MQNRDEPCKKSKSEILTEFPAYCHRFEKMHLCYGVPRHVIRRNGQLEVVDRLRSGYHTEDERFVCTITDEDVFTETVQIENYINLYHKYPKTTGESVTKLFLPGWTRSWNMIQRLENFIRREEKWMVTTSCMLLIRHDCMLYNDIFGK